MLKIILIRHGHSLSNKKKTFTGQLDIALSETGYEQARLTSEYVIKNYKIDKIFSSPLSRAVDTVKSVSEHFGVDIKTDDRLKEIYGGEWEGMLFDEIAVKYPIEHGNWKKDVGHTRCPNGESMGDVTERVKSFLNEKVLTLDDMTVVIAAHAGVLRAMQCYMQKVDLTGMQDVPWLPNSSVSVIDYSNEEFTPEYFGYTDHLGDAITNLPKSI